MMKVSSKSNIACGARTLVALLAGFAFRWSLSTKPYELVCHKGSGTVRVPYHTARVRVPCLVGYS
eukprot:scaffold370378_cov19-Prasinocladus_malaysianus.AAC.1